MKKAILHDALDYNPSTGEFVWKVRRGSVSPGTPAGTKSAHGALVIRLNGKLEYAHRLAWEHVHGRPPNGEIDHINGDPSDNRISNLRECTRVENTRNVRCHVDTASGLKGAYRDKNRWCSRIRVFGKNVHLGSFDTAEDAAAAYDAAALKYFGEFACVNGDRDADTNSLQ